VYAARVKKRAAKTQPRRKSSTRGAAVRTAAAKAGPRRVSKPKAAAPSKTSAARKIADPPEPNRAALDPRVAAAIALALRDAAASDARARELAEAPSAWTLAGRAARVQTRWTR
jgi:hypothetical protein